MIKDEVDRTRQFLKLLKISELERFAVDCGISRKTLERFRSGAEVKLSIYVAIADRVNRNAA